MSQQQASQHDRSSTPQALLQWLAAQKDAMVGLLGEIVNIDSGSYNKSGVDAVGASLVRFLAAHDVRTTIIPNERFGDFVRAEVGDAGAGAPILLMGHRDTVFPDGEAGRRPFRIENGRAYGPGVSDMKAGLVMHCFVLAAFRRFGGHAAPLMALFTGDEEIASPSSRPVIEAHARGARCAFNAEPARASGNVVTGRKGGVFMRCEVFGKAAHSGGAFADGASAISELARKIVALDALTDLPKAITLNAGTIRGGQSINTTAPYAQAEIDFRFVSSEDRAARMPEIERIVATSSVKGTHAKLTITGEFLPLVATPQATALFEHYQAAAREFGQEVEGAFSGGCADSGFSSGVGTPTLCGVGPIGGKAHTAEEFLEIDSMVPRAQALALTIARMA